jgi:hypothetical protein
MRVVFSRGGASVVPFGAKYKFCRICAASGFNHVKGVVNRSPLPRSPFANAPTTAAAARVDKYFKRPKMRQIYTHRTHLKST